MAYPFKSGPHWTVRLARGKPTTASGLVWTGRDQPRSRSPKALSVALGAAAAMVLGFGLASGEHPQDLSRESIATAASHGLTAAMPVPPRAEVAERAFRDERPLVVAQRPQAMTVDVIVHGATGERVRLPVKIDPQAIAGGSHLMLHKVPPWLSIAGGESVGSGVWLVAPGQLEKAELAFGPGATGNHEVVVSLLSKEGRVISESKLLINIRSGIEATPKHWSALVGKSESAPPPSAAAPPAAKAPSGPVVAQAAKQPPPKSAGPPKSEAQLVTYAKHLVRECTTCHSLYGQDVGIPVMIGLTRDRFLDTMRLYRSGKRDNQAMQVVSQSLDDEQTLALALYLGRIKPPPQPASASAAAAAEKAVAVPTRRAGTPGNVDRIDRWLRRGQQLLDGGDIAQARLLFERAAEFGSGRAMILLAASYDPNVLPWRPGMGLEAEPLKARRIYLEAKKLGMVAEADQRLADLPER